MRGRGRRNYEAKLDLLTISILVEVNNELMDIASDNFIAFFLSTFQVKKKYISILFSKEKVGKFCYFK